MFENKRNKSVDKSPPRIRPPDTSIPQDTEPVWSEELSVPKPKTDFPRWLSVEQIRKMQRMRRETVMAAMESGELPFEKRGRICYARLADVLAWEERRLRSEVKTDRFHIHPDLAGLA